MAIIKWEPFRELADLRRQIDRLMEESFPWFRGEEIIEREWSFPVDIKDTPEAVIVRAELPGMRKEDIKINLTDNLLTIEGERKSEEKVEGVDFVKVERYYGHFSRSFTVDAPIKPGEIKARYQDGVLEITLPKKEVTKKEEVKITIEG